VDIAICSDDRLCVAIDVFDREVTLLQLLILVTDIKPDGVPEESRSLVGATEAQPGDDPVIVDVVELRVRVLSSGDSS